MKRIFSTYHHGFAGGSKNTSRLLNYLAAGGDTIDAFFFETPQFFSYNATKINLHTLNFSALHSEVIDVQHLTNYALEESIINCANNSGEAILFGANIFPYCNILHDVKSKLDNSTRNNTRLAIHPVGSDLWQIGPKFKSRVKWLLDSPDVDVVVTYSQTFADEIKAQYDIQRDITIVPPVLEPGVFAPIESAEKLARRLQAGFSANDFIIHHHSSMRRIKCPEVVVKIAKNAAEFIDRNVVLLMVGPVPFELADEMGLELRPSHNPLFLYETSFGNLTIYWTGTLTNVTFLMQLSDTELNASIHDSFNISLMEAMACGLPVITSDVVGIGDHILKSNGGICFPTKKLSFKQLNDAIDSGKAMSVFFDIDYAVSAVICLSNKSETAFQMGAAGANYVENAFSVHRIAPAFRQLLNLCQEKTTY